MPCRDYYSDTNDNTVSEWQYRELKARADMLARIACKSLTELEANGIAELLLLRDDEVREVAVKQVHEVMDPKKFMALLTKTNYD